MTDSAPVAVRVTDAGVLTVALGNASSSTLGSVAATQASTPLGIASNFTGGIFVWNADTTLAVYLGVGTITAIPGPNTICLGPGQGIHIDRADISLLQVIATSGAPVVSWQGLTL